MFIIVNIRFYLVLIKQSLLIKKNERKRREKKLFSSIVESFTEIILLFVLTYSVARSFSLFSFPSLIVYSDYVSVISCHVFADGMVSTTCSG